MPNMSHGSAVSPSGRRNDAMAIRATPWLPRASDSRPTGTLRARGVQAEREHPEQPEAPMPNMSHGSAVSPSGRRNDAMAIRATPWLPRASDSRPTGTLRAWGVQAERARPEQHRGAPTPNVQHEPRERSVPVGKTKRRHGHQGNALVASRFRFATGGDTARPGRPGGSREERVRAPQYRTATSVSPCGGAVIPASLRGAPSSSARNDSVSRRPRPHSSIVPTSTRTM